MSENNHKSQIKLKQSAILNVPFHKYEKDFTFIVNGKEFETNRLIADLFSKKICDLHSIDSTINEFSIKTESSGDFSKILTLINFKYDEISETEIPFLCELDDILDFSNLEFNFNVGSNSPEKTMNNIFDLLSKHEQNKFYSMQLNEDIDFLSSNFFEVSDEQINYLKKLKITTIEKVIKNDKLRLKCEDQLLNVINELYKEDINYSYLYNYVEFVNCSENSISEFIAIFDKEDMSAETWRKIAIRLSSKIETTGDTKSERYESTKGIEIRFNNSNEFDGIINYLRNRSQTSIEDLVTLTASSRDEGTLNDIIKYENNQNGFYTGNTFNSWICIEFKENQIIPSHYTIRTYAGTACHQKTWIIECSNDNENWEKIDEQTNCEVMNKKGFSHTFNIENVNKPFKYFRLKQTGPTWYGCNYLVINAIEIYGTLI